MKFAGVFLFFIVIVISPVLAQEDFIVTTKADTIRGELKIVSYDLLDRVQVSVNKKKTLYTALQIKSISMEGSIYHPQRYENSIRFMRVLKSGYLSLYSFRLPNQMTYDGYFLVKMDSKSMEVPNLGFKKIISGFMEDCPDVVSKIKEDQFKKSDLNTIIDEYNACIEKKTNEIQAQKIAAASSGDKTEALKNLQSKVNAQETLANKKDVLDLLTDITDKTSKLQSIPNYQLEALKGYLNGTDAVKEELENVIRLLKVN